MTEQEFPTLDEATIIHADGRLEFVATNDVDRTVAALREVLDEWDEADC